MLQQNRFVLYRGTHTDSLHQCGLRFARQWRFAGQCSVDVDCIAHRLAAMTSPIVRKQHSHALDTASSSALSSASNLILLITIFLYRQVKVGTVGDPGIGKWSFIIRCGECNSYYQKGDDTILNECCWWWCDLVMLWSLVMVTCYLTDGSKAFLMRITLV